MPPPTEGHVKGKQQLKVTVNAGAHGIRAVTPKQWVRTRFLQNGKLLADKENESSLMETKNGAACAQLLMGR